MGENKGAEKEKVVKDTVVVNPSYTEGARGPQKGGMAKQNNEWSMIDA
jgi:hypothetical protein